MSEKYMKEIAQELKELRREISKLREAVNAKTKRSGRAPVTFNLRERSYGNEDPEPSESDTDPGGDTV